MLGRGISLPRRICLWNERTGGFNDSLLSFLPLDQVGRSYHYYEGDIGCLCTRKILGLVQSQGPGMGWVGRRMVRLVDILEKRRQDSSAVGGRGSGRLGVRPEPAQVLLVAVVFRFVVFGW